MSGLCLGDGHIPCPGDGRFYLCLFSFRLSRRGHVRPFRCAWQALCPGARCFAFRFVCFRLAGGGMSGLCLGDGHISCPGDGRFAFRLIDFRLSRRRVRPFCRAWHALCPAKGVFIKAFFPRRAKGRFGRACPLAFPHKRWDNLPNTPFCFQRRPMV